MAKPNQRLNGLAKSVFITGGASGLGRALALRCAARGWRVCLGDTDHEAGRSVCVELENEGASDSLFLPCDVRSLSDLTAVRDILLERWGGLDCLVNNAGVALAGPLTDFEMSDWEWALDINLLGVVRGCKVFAPHFKEQGSGHIVNIASMAGLADVALTGPYGVSKAGVVKVTETLHQELRSYGIECSVVCPYFFQSNLRASLRVTDSRYGKMVDRLFLGSRLTVDELAQLCFENFQNPRLFVLPTYREKWSWWLKRYLPRSYYTFGVRKMTGWFTK